MQTAITPRQWKGLSKLIQKKKDKQYQMNVVHAPEGGTTVDGTYYLGGQFLPSGGTEHKGASASVQERQQYMTRADAHARAAKPKQVVANLPHVGKVTGLQHGNLLIHKVGDKHVISHMYTGKKVGEDNHRSDALRKAYLLHHGLEWHESAGDDPKHKARYEDVSGGVLPRDLPIDNLRSDGDLPGNDHDKAADEALKKQSSEWVRFEPNYMKMKEDYLKKNATFDEAGNIKSVAVNTDEWRDFIPGYMGTNSAAVHEAASYANHKLLGELLEGMKGKGNGKIAILGGGGGCHGINTPIMMYDGSIKMVQDVKVGEKLMGPDSKPRAVLSLCRGSAPMYRVVPTKGESFTVNGDHILSLHTITRNRDKSRRRDCRVEITVDQALNRGKRFFDNFFLYRVPVDYRYMSICVDPYFLGLWLGDGTHCAAQITSADKEIADYLAEFVKGFPELNLRSTGKPGNKASRHDLALKSQRPVGQSGLPINPLMELLRRIGVMRNKHIPDAYMINDRSVRIQLLAGLIDSDGCYDNRGGYDFITKHEHLAEQVERLARSLGFSAYAKRCRKSSQTGFRGTYYRMFICGDIDRIPVKLPRRKARPRATHYLDGKRTRNVLHVGFSIRPIGFGDFYGFTLEGDGLYLLGDFTVTHNSGKGTAVGNHFDERDYPIRIDQTSADYAKLSKEIDEIKSHGYEPDIVFIDRNPQEAWKGVVGRAMSMLKKGANPRTVPASVAVQANIDARRVALMLAKERPDVKLRVIDNNGKAQDSRLLKDREEIISHLSRKEYNADEEKKGALKHVDELESEGHIPARVAKGLRGT